MGGTGLLDVLLIRSTFFIFSNIDHAKVSVHAFMNIIKALLSSVSVEDKNCGGTLA